jgi:universal stress protein A
MARRPRSQAKQGRYRRILWPTDFSRLADAALPHALGLAAAGRAELIVLHVISPLVVSGPPPITGVAWKRLDAEMRAAAKKELCRAVARVKADDPELHVRSLSAAGSPFEQIPRTAQRLRCDLIVLATHGRSGLKHFFLGSVAENVVRRAPCPVLTVRPTGAARGRGRRSSGSTEERAVGREDGREA